MKTHQALKNTRWFADTVLRELEVQKYRPPMAFMEAWGAPDGVYAPRLRTLGGPPGTGRRERLRTEFASGTSVSPAAGL